MNEWPTRTIQSTSYLKGRIGWQGLRADEFLEEGPFLITGTDFTGGEIDWSNCYHVSEWRYREAAYIHVKNGDILITKDGTIGKVALVERCPEKAVLNSGIFLLRCADGSYDHGFVYYVLTSELFSDFLRKSLNGSTINHLYQHVFEKFRVPLPDKKEQKKIARILQTIDEAIKKTEALIDKYRQIKSGLMHDLFSRGIGADGHLRPPRQQAPELYQKTSIGWIPNDWEPLRLSEILQKSGGYLQTGPFGSQLHSHEYTDEGIPVVMPQDINNGTVEDLHIARITESRAQTLAKHRLKIGDIIIARRGDLSRAAAISQTEDGWVCGTGCFLLRLGGSSLDSRFFSLAYRHSMVQRQVDGLAVGSTMPSLNNGIVSKLVFPYMRKGEQAAIADKVQLVDDRRTYAEMELKKLKRLKLGLMHDLLTGEIPVRVESEEERSVETV